MSTSDKTARNGSVLTQIKRILVLSFGLGTVLGLSLGLLVVWLNLSHGLTLALASLVGTIALAVTLREDPAGKFHWRLRNRRRDRHA